MNRIRVTSSNVASICYDGSSILEVEFLSGSIYQYYGVPKTIYDNLMAAPSKGGYLAAYIKGIYRYERIL